MNIYHVLPPNFTGSVLYPLNALKETLPDVYAMQVQKYRGREALLSRRLPYIGCLWNDVLHFSPVHPEQIRRAIESVGFPWKPQGWFEVDPERLGLDETNTVIYTSPFRAKGDIEASEDDFIPFSLETLEMLTSIPQATYEYFNHAKAHDERPFLFNTIPHVLYYGALDTQSAAVQRILV